MHQQYTKIEFDEHLDVINNWLKEFVHINDLYIVESFFSILNKDIWLYVLLVLVMGQ